MPESHSPIKGESPAAGGGDSTQRFGHQCELNLTAGLIDYEC
jgi:hypothetical protein